MKTSELIGPALAYAAGIAEGFTPHAAASLVIMESYNPNTNWSQGGPIIERENITTIRANSDYVDGKNVPSWFAETNKWVGHGISTSVEGEYFDPCFMIDEAGGKYGPTPLIAAMRCYVASKLGDEVEIPSELLS